MPNGEASVMGGQVIIEKIDREDAGEYQCWDMRDNITNTHKYVNVLCEYIIPVTEISFLPYFDNFELCCFCITLLMQQNPAERSLSWLW